MSLKLKNKRCTKTQKVHSMDTKLKWYQRICLELLWAFFLLLSYMPRFLRYYVLKPFIAIILILLGYRRKVIITNLTNSFPEKDTLEIKQICRRYYYVLAEVIVDTISLVGAGEDRKDKAVNWINHQELNAELDGKDWIAMGAHYGCWEYLPLWSRVQKCNTFMSVYHPLKSTVFDVFYQRIRLLSDNIALVPMRNTFAYYLRNRNKGKGIILGLLSDQSPYLHADSHWFKFMNQDTTFIDGAESIALKFKLPIYFANTTRLAPGRYVVHMDQIYDGKEEVPKHAITERYARKLEEMIHRCPELWMWSHRRWKHTPEEHAKYFSKDTTTDQQ